MATTDPQARDRVLGKGHGTESLGPSDSSDTGSDVVGGPGLGRDVARTLDLDRGTTEDANLGAGPQDGTAGPDLGDSDLESDSDSGGTGERAAAGRDDPEPYNRDRDTDRVVGGDDPSLGLTHGPQRADGRTVHVADIADGTYDADDLLDADDGVQTPEDSDPTLNGAIIDETGDEEDEVTDADVLDEDADAAALRATKGRQR